MTARLLLAKGLQAVGLLVAGMALLVGLESDDMTRELMTLLAGSLVFLAGHLVEPRQG